MNLQSNVNQIVNQVADLHAKQQIAKKIAAEKTDKPKTPQGATYSQQQVDYLIQSRDQAMERIRQQVSNEYKQKQAYKTRIANLKQKVKTLEGDK